MKLCHDDLTSAQLRLGRWRSSRGQPCCSATCDNFSRSGAVVRISAGAPDGINFALISANAENGRHVSQVRRRNRGLIIERWTGGSRHIERPHAAVGSAAAPAVRYRKFRRGSFIFEPPSHHSITSSARASSDGGTSRPSAFARGPRRLAGR